MKKLLTITFIFIVSVLFCGFSLPQKKEKPFVILSSQSQPNMSDGKIRFERHFVTGQKIYWILYAPDGFKDNGIRIRLTKHDDKTSNWGYTILSSRDIYVEKSENCVRDFFIIRQKGQYLLEFFYVSNKDYPFARTEFLAD